jgi:hypothetical protein
VSANEEDLPPEPPAQSRIEAVVEDCEFMAAMGETFTGAAARLGYSNRKNLERVLWRARRGDLVRRLKAHEEDELIAERARDVRRRHRLAA